MMGGYFLLHGKKMFSEIFFNHMPSMAYISALIQHLTKPDSIYMLIYQHRMFMIYLSIIADIFLTLRFGVVGFGFAILFESTKGFIFGDRFLAEPIIVYPVVYLWGLVWEFLQKKRVSPFEVFLATIFTWFVVFTREPYIPLVLMLFAVMLWFMRKTVWIWWSGILLFLMSLASVTYFGINDFMFNVFTVNEHNITIEATQVAAQSGGTWSVFLYPLQVFYEGNWNLFREVEAGLMALLILFGILVLVKSKNISGVIIALAVLTLANIRTIIPGSLYYGTFHHIEWYALVIFTVLSLLVKVWQYRNVRWISLIGGAVFLGLSVYALVSPASYLHEQVDRQTEFTTNYNQYYVVGETVRLLSNPADTLFLDGQDDLIYWQAGRYSDYPYSWYTSLMPYFTVYTKARDEMLKKDPPVFFYGRCWGKSNEFTTMPPQLAYLYVRLDHDNAPSCLYIKNNKIPHITTDQWKSIEQFNYSLPKAVTL